MSHRRGNLEIRSGLFGALFLISGVIFFYGCASLPILREAAVPIDQFEAYIGPDGIPISPESVDADIPDTDILSISSDMASALNNAVPRTGDLGERLDALVEFLARTVRYDTMADGYGAKTARETFEAGTGNCLSFSNLFVAMARRAGLDAKYQEIPTPPNWEREGEVLFFTRHIGASVDIAELGGGAILFEITGLKRSFTFDNIRRFFFVPSALNPFSQRINLSFARRISDQRAFAQYYNNLGSRHLAEGNAPDAFRFFIKSVKTDPALGFVWSNLGVVYSRNGQFDAARKAFLRGLTVSHGARDVTALSIMNNMVELYKKSGDEEEAALYKKEVAAFRLKNPYYQYTVAKGAYSDGLYEQSVGHFKRAIRLKNDDPLFYYGLALAYLKLGDMKKAERSIRKAKRHAFGEENKLYYDQVRRDIVNGNID